MNLKQEDRKTILAALEHYQTGGFETGDLITRFEQSLHISKGKKKTKANPDNVGTAPDWSGSCDNCGASPIVPATSMCGPCTFGEADTAGGNW